MFNLFPGQGLGGKSSWLFAFGLGSFGQIEIVVVPSVYALPPGPAGGGGGTERRTYLFLPHEVRFRIQFGGPVHEAHFEIPQTIGKIFAKKVPMLVKANIDEIRTPVVIISAKKESEGGNS